MSNVPALRDASPTKISAIVGGVLGLIALLTFFRKIISK